MTNDEASEFAAVVLNVPIEGPFHYRVPEPLKQAIQRGARVRVPFGRREMIGYCVGFDDEIDFDESRVKDIIELLDRPPILDERMLELTRWMSRYYCCSWGEALDAVLPAGVKKRTAARTVLLVAAARAPEEMRARADQVETRAPRQARALRALARTQGEISARDLAGLAEIDYGVINALRRWGFVSTRREKVTDDPTLGFRVEHSEPPVPTHAQAAAFKRIEAILAAGKFRVCLLHGVTGSGKTELYLQALQRVVRSGRQGIVLVPEIALTPQTVARFKARFDRVCVLHSELTERHRREQWRTICNGKADVVIGARSAIFAPVPRLGLLVVDEEHEPSYKQQSVPRYHGRDVGIWRARQENALVILGSATPSLESFHNARTGKYELLELPERVEGRPLPPVEIHDMSADLDKNWRPPLVSRRLRLAIEATLQKDEQVILLLNRRGFNTCMMCPKCGFVLRCKHCDVSLIYHRNTGRTLCHYCGYETALPATCPGCGHRKVKYLGTGTERVEEYIGKLFGADRVARMDSDSMHGWGSYQKTLGDFRDGKTPILLGTQMVAKGLDFPKVTLVGVINADTSLNLPDFRASERTFQLLAQVAGRAGRSERGGHVIVQTFSPDHPCVRCAARHDYLGFAELELADRKDFGYPPFSRLARIIVEGRKLGPVKERCDAVVKDLAAACKAGPVKVLGPAEAPIARIKARFRWHALVKAPTSTQLRETLSVIERGPWKGTRVIVDVDPVSLL